MYRIPVYSITPKLWRWELRCGGAPLHCPEQGRRREGSELGP
jgi:hypothetical protein